MRYTSILVLLCILSITAIGNAQESPEFIKYKNAYPDEYLARLTSQRLIDISLDDDEIKISQTIEEEDLLLNETAQFATEESVEYSSFFLLDKIEAASLVYDGKKYREYEVTDFVRKDELSESFYDDTKSVNFLYPKLQQGAIKKLNYTTSITNPRFLSPVYFGNVYPLIKQKVEIVVDKDINLRFQKFNMEGVDVRFRESEKRGRKIYTWEIENQEAYDLESNGPSPKTILPHIIPIISSYEKKNEEIPVLNGVKDLYNWYYSLVKDINQEELDDELVTITNDLIASKTSEIDKVKAIYYWVQENIKYIDFEYALGGFIPRDANAVFQKKFGDCKDNSSILKEMFKIAKIKGSLTWLGTRSIPYSYEDVPTPAADNHMILTYESEGETYFLDATGRYLPLEIPSSFIQGKEALIGNGEGDFRVEQVPVMDALKNATIDTVYISIDDENIVGKGKIELSGYEKNYYFNYLESIKTDEKRTSFYNSILRKGSNSFLVDKFEEKNIYEYDKNFIIEYDFKIANYVKSIDDEIYVNLNLNKDLSSFKTKKDRKHEIKNTYKVHYNYQTIFEIPEGYEVSYMPEDITVENDLIRSAITYKHEGNKILYSHNGELNYLVLSIEEQKKVNKLIKKIEKNYKEIIILKKKK